MHKRLYLLLPALLIAACSQNAMDKPMASSKVSDHNASSKLTAALASQPADNQARYGYRHPKETLEFFGIKPGMTVVEALPGGGWYSKILIDYLGTDGHLIGVDYPIEMYPLFGFFPAEFIEKKKTWTHDWQIEANEWRSEHSARISAFVIGSAPANMNGKADAVLFIRALHNLNRFESKGGFLTKAMTDAYNVLKPGGIVGVVQHHSPDSMSDEWADGSNGYLKKDALIARMKAAGFSYVASSDINANPKDQPTADDIVWRLPPTLLTSKDNPEMEAKMRAIGESNRMTLLFRKR